jgi:hypothetical protein
VALYDLNWREKFTVDHPMIVLKEGHSWPPPSNSFDAYAYALKVCLGLKEQLAIFEAKIASGGRHTDGDLHAPHLAKQDVIKILRFAFGVPKHPAEDAVNKAWQDAGL